MITKHITDLLYKHECVIVPGLGGFIKAYNPAHIIHATHQFLPPSGSVAFNAGLCGNDGQLANHIAETEKISYRDALNEIRLWVTKNLDHLNNGNKVSLDGIGELFLNVSGKIEFTPAYQVNFNADSFGLPEFVTKGVYLAPVVIPEMQSAKHKWVSRLRTYIPETLKWAALLAPFIAFTIWGSLNGNVIDNYVHNYTGMYSWVRSTPGKTATINPANLPKQTNSNLQEKTQSPASIMEAENLPFEPGSVSYAELSKNKITIAEPVAEPVSEPLVKPILTSKITETSIPAQPTQGFHIISGAFRDHSNALKHINTLKDQGYVAAIVDTTPAGLYVVSLKGFDSYDEASKQLTALKKAGFSSYWILKKKSA
jgi:cell division septation protein DedD